VADHCLLPDDELLLVLSGWLHQSYLYHHSSTNYSACITFLQLSCTSPSADACAVLRSFVQLGASLSQCVFVERILEVVPLRLAMKLCLLHTAEVGMRITVGPQVSVALRVNSMLVVV
jgi:hypothetical protein